MKKLTSARFLVGVAIVASAVALQVREHVLPQDNEAADQQAEMSSCGPAHGGLRDGLRGGLIPAACQATRDEQTAKPATPMPRDPQQLWV